jgi:hypothetical protein
MSTLESQPQETHPVPADGNVLVDQTMVNDFRPLRRRDRQAGHQLEKRRLPKSHMPMR